MQSSTGTIWVMSTILLAGCQTASPLSGDAMQHEPPRFGNPVVTIPGDDAGRDAGDAGVDASHPNLVALCGSEPLTAADWEACYHRRWCEWQVGCRPTNSYSNVQDCIEQSDKVELGLFTVLSRKNERAVARGQASVNVPVFTQCLLDLDRVNCDTAMSSESCATRYVGMVQDGGDCYDNAECASPGATCDAQAACSEACCLGTCHRAMNEGETCTTVRCAPGLICHGTCRSGNVGTPCGSSRDCDENAWCDRGTCAADLTPGTACASLAQCSGDTRCLGLSIVVSTPGTCLRTARPGDPCDSICYGNVYCDGSGICRELPQLHQPCSAMTGCSGYDNVCSNGQCVPRGDVGTACGSSAPCVPGLFCDSSSGQPTCAARRATGQPCTDASQCESYLCSVTAAMPVCLEWSDTCPAPQGR